MQALLARDAIVVDGRPVGKSHRLVAGTVIEMLEEPAVGAPPAGDPSVAVDVRYADDDVIVRRQAGRARRAPRRRPPRRHARERPARAVPGDRGVGDELRPGIVHRLDRDTSGLLGRGAHRARVRQPRRADLGAARVDRRYVALVWGAFSSPRGVIDAPIGRSTARRTRMAVRESGKAARTEYEVRVAYDRARVRAARLPARDRPHAPDPRAPRARSGIRSSATRTYGGSREAIRARPPVPARRAASRSTSRPPASASASRTPSPPTSPPSSRRRSTPRPPHAADARTSGVWHQRH